jgi:hypothetical protein
LCTGEVKESGRCSACNDLGKNENIRKVVSRYTDGVHENAPLIFHGIGGLIDVAHRKTAVIDRFRLLRLNNMKKLFLKQGVIDVQKQMLLAISTQRIPRIDHVLRRGFAESVGMHGMLSLIKRAAEGTYHPKGFDEEDELQALLFLRLGGARVAEIAHRMFGTPSVSTIRTRTTVPQLLASPSYPTPNEVKHNVVATFQSLRDLLSGLAESTLHAVLMFDELATEKRPRWDDKTNKFLGLCREHGSETSIEFTSEEDLATLFDDLAHGNIHLASEVSVDVCCALTPLSSLFARPYYPNEPVFSHL